jgi:hypothetical protein
MQHPIRTVLVVALKALGRFLAMAMRPLPSVWSWYLNIPSSLLTLAAGSLIGAKAGSHPASGQTKAPALSFWPWGAIGLLIGAFLLILWAGFRLEYEKVRREIVSIRFKAFPAEKTRGSLGEEWVQQIRVTNLGPPSSFTAALGSDIEGITSPNRGAGTQLAWEQTAETARRIGHGETATIRLATFAAHPTGSGARLRLWIPPSPYSGDQYGVGAIEETTAAGLVNFVLEVRDVERDVVRSCRVMVVCDRAGKPTVQPLS